MASQESTTPGSFASDAAKPGTTFCNLFPIPTTAQSVNDPDREEVANSMTEEPTLSHALAMRYHDEKGAAQHGHDEEDVANLGWNEKKEKIREPLVGGLGNEELWLLIRRFNKQMSHVREVADAVPGDLDLNIAYKEEFSPDKLRSNIERLYMTVIIDLLRVVKHIARLRSWRETRRATAFCAAYSIAWVFDCITPLLICTAIALIVLPRARSLMFPPAPIALVDSKSGCVQEPTEGALGSFDSMTGAPENHKGEAVEQEASNFFKQITSICVTGAIGKHPQSGPHTDENGPGDAISDPTGLAAVAADAKDVAAGGKPSADHDKTKVPVDNAMWTQMRPLMHGVADVSDTWERFANALAPTPPFPKDIARLRLASLLVPLLVISCFTTSYMFMKGITFAVGFGFFGDPVIALGLRLLSRKLPHWQKLLEVRNTILKGVPTNAQLTLTLLRIGEANKAPLPPPPRVNVAPRQRSVSVTDAELRAPGAEPSPNATEEELEAAVLNERRFPHETGGGDIDVTKTVNHGRKGSKILSFFKGITKSIVKTTIGADSVRAKAGSNAAKSRLGAVPRPNVNLNSGPIDFKARFKGKKGHLYITTKATIPAMAFSTDVTIEKIGSAEREDLHPLWSIPVGDIKELKKIDGYGWKGNLVVGWSLGRKVVDGLEITDRVGTSWKLTALPLRNELFSRLIAIGGQKWEAW